MKYTRIDHTDELVHFTKDFKSNSSKWGYEESYKLFCKIISDGFLKESTSLRLGNIATICFTEASYTALTENGELNTKYFSRYSPFGFMFAKSYIFTMGGRPAIYSPKAEFEKDNDKTNWRTVNYHPTGNEKLFRDFSWEREWRIKTDNGILKLDSQWVKLVFPSRAWAERFRDDHDEYHQLESCDCQCTRECEIINYDRYLAIEQGERLEGTCDEQTNFPWTLINMNCYSIPLPK